MTRNNLSSRGHNDQFLKFLSLTPREKEVLGLLTLGYNNKQVAKELVIAIRTVELHRFNIKKKLKVSELRDLIRIYLEVRKVDELRDI